MAIGKAGGGYADVVNDEGNEFEGECDELEDVALSGLPSDVVPLEMSVDVGGGTSTTAYGNGAGDFLSSRQTSRSLKYSKSREVGTEGDLLFAFALRDTSAEGAGVTDSKTARDAESEELVDEANEMSTERLAHTLPLAI